jgi:PhnB protein
MQIYVNGSVEAVELYANAFSSTLGFNEKSADGTFYNSELNIGGQIIAVAEADGERITGSTMQFCLQFGEDEIDKLTRAYEFLKRGAEIFFPLGPCDFSSYMTDLVDKFGVRWCLFVG